MDFNQFFTHTKGHIFADVDFDELEVQGFSIVETQREPCSDSAYTGTVVYDILRKDKTLKLATFQAYYSDGLGDVTLINTEWGYDLLILRAAHIVSIHFQERFLND